MTTFDNIRVLFRTKSIPRLFQEYVVYRLCGSSPVMKAASRFLVSKNQYVSKSSGYFIRSFVLPIFAGGQNLHSCKVNF